MKEFLKDYKVAIRIPLGCLVIFAVLFLLFQLELRIFYLGVGLTVIYTLFILSFAYVYHKKEHQQLDELKQELREQKLEIAHAIKMRKDLEEYFLLWVHQIKTPITATDLLLNEPELNQEELKTQLISIENYTNMAMNYIKISNPDTDMDFASTTLHDIISPLLKKYSIQFINKEITLHYERIEDSVLTDAKLTSIVVEQILNNALKYTKQGDIWITFDKKTHALAIKDSGIGIPPENIQKIFDKGYSGFNGRLNQKSSGLGLYLAKEITKRLNHTLSVKSELGEGSTFTIHFEVK